MKTERLSEDRVQYLVYQILRGLKVCVVYIYPLTYTHTHTHLLMYSISSCSQYIHAAGIIHRVSCMYFHILLHTSELIMHC